MKSTGDAVWPQKECFSVSSVRIAFTEEVILALELRHFSSFLAQTISSPPRSKSLGGYPLCSMEI